MPTHESAEDERHILVVANETVGGDELLAILRDKSAGVNEQVLVVCPALNSPVRTWASDEDGARSAAQDRLDASLARLRQDGVQAQGEIGDGDPLQAIEDALRTFGADEIVISTHPEGRSNWLERNVVGAARERFDVPITHVVVDLEADATALLARARRLPARAGDDVVGDRLDLLRRVLVLEGRHHALPVRDAIDHELLRRLRVVEVGADVAARARGVERVTAAAAGLGEDRLAVRAPLSPPPPVVVPPCRAAARSCSPARAARGQPGNRGDVGRDRVGVLALEQVGGHSRRAVFGATIG